MKCIRKPNQCDDVKSTKNNTLRFTHIHPDAHPHPHAHTHAHTLRETLPPHKPSLSLSHTRTCAEVETYTIYLLHTQR